MKRGPHDTFSNASIDRRATVTLHETLVPKPKAKRKHVSRPGTYAEPKPDGAALPRTQYKFAPLPALPQPYVRDGAADFLKHPSKGFSC